MSNTLFIKPAVGCLIRDPRTRIPLDGGGEEKPANGFWLRRLRDNSVIRTERPKATRVASPAESAASPVSRNKKAEVKNGI